MCLIWAHYPVVICFISVARRWARFMVVDNPSRDSEKILIGGVGEVTKTRAKSLRNLICWRE